MISESRLLSTVTILGDFNVHLGSWRLGVLTKYAIRNAAAGDIGKM